MFYVSVCMYMYVKHIHMYVINVNAKRQMFNDFKHNTYIQLYSSLGEVNIERSLKSFFFEIL